jgi:hypothetical protein
MSAIEKVENAAYELGTLRREWAQSFLIYRINAKTDLQARAMADEELIEKLTLAEARYAVAVSLLGGTSYAHQCSAANTAEATSTGDG